jgi:hypothetical protein
MNVIHNSIKIIERMEIRYTYEWQKLLSPWYMGGGGEGEYPPKGKRD